MAKMLAMELSDLHLGEESSVLHYGDKYKEKGTQPLVNKLAESIRNRIGDQKISFLILAGDALDLSLASVQNVIADFRLFLEDVHEFFENSDTRGVGEDTQGRRRYLPWRGKRRWMSYTRCGK